MYKKEEYRSIYRAILDSLDNEALSRADIILSVARSKGLNTEEIANQSIVSKYNALRGMTGAIINELCAKGILRCNHEGRYSITEDKPIAIRIEQCEQAILTMLSGSPRTRSEIKDSLTYFFATDTTDTKKDDAKLFTYIGQILKRLTAENIICFDGGKYKILPSRAAEIRDRGALLSLRSDFLNLLHSKGGEFFEVYFMNLLSKYLVRMGKTVTECYTTGGSNDGGIDGIAKTVDSLGFRETIMVQTKNRLDVMSETDVRGFYGALCARGGSRGMFVTTSDFHEGALDFLNSVDNCVGINGAKIFSMACDTDYGIKREGKRLLIDKDIF